MLRIALQLDDLQCLYRYVGRRFTLSVSLYVSTVCAVCIAMWEDGFRCLCRCTERFGASVSM